MKNRNRDAALKAEPSEITLRLNGKYPTMSREDLTKAVHVLLKHIVDLREQMTELAIDLHRATEPEALMAVTATGFIEERAAQVKLLDELRRLLEFAIEEGFVDRKRVNEAVTGKPDTSLPYSGAAPDLGVYESQ